MRAVLPLAASSLTFPDYAVLLGALLVVLGIGARFGRRQKDTEDFFLAGRHIPWWAALLSFMATEISALTIVGVPATAYKENWLYLQYFIGSSAAKLGIAFLFIPAFYRLRVTTIYQLLGHRFGPATQVTAALFFFVTRLLGSGVRLMAAAVAVAILLDWRLDLTIAVFTLVSIAYIAAGGVSAIVWSNVLQAALFLAAGVAALLFVTSQAGGPAKVWELASSAGRLQVINGGAWPWEPGFLRQALTGDNILWVAILNGFVGSLAAFGTDHDLMQRLLAVETRGASQRTLALSPLPTLLVVLVHLALGAALFAFYALHPDLHVARADHVFPEFARDVMPAGLRGLVLTAILLASLDSPLGALAASFVTDIYRPRLAPGRSEQHYLLVSRLSVLAFGLALALLAWGFSFFERILWLAFQIAGVTFGSLLGVFLLALLSERRLADRGNALAMVAMAGTNLALLVLIRTQVIALHWSWLVILGTAGTVLLALLFDRVLAQPPGPGSPAGPPSTQPSSASS